MNINLRQIIGRLTCALFLLQSTGAPSALADSLTLPAPGTMVHLSPTFNPSFLTGIKVHPDNPLRFDFIVDQGSNRSVTKEESAKLVKYFLASLTTPEKDIWVNLSPYEKDRIVPESFGHTEMGRDLLAQDYLLKQITASLVYPEGATGKEFWKRIYDKTAQELGTSHIPVNAFNKVWIVPEKAVLYENVAAGTVYIVESSLKVMLESDYLAHDKNHASKEELSKTVARRVLIPLLTKEVNEGKNFAQLRQVYNSLILATWYKRKVKESVITSVYSNQRKTTGLNVRDPKAAEKIYGQYLQAFKKGAFNYVKEEEDPSSQRPIARKYFSGGFNAAALDAAMTYVSRPVERSNLAVVSTDLAMATPEAKLGWEDFIAGGIREIVPWEEHDSYVDLYQVPSHQITDADPNIYIPDPESDRNRIVIPAESLKRAVGGVGLVLGFGARRSGELRVLQRKFKLSKVHGVDFVADMVGNTAKELDRMFPKGHEDRSKYVLHHAGAEDLGFLPDGSVDVVYLSGMLQGDGIKADQEPQVVREILRVLKVGGIAIFVHTHSFVLDHLDEGYIDGRLSELTNIDDATRHRLEALGWFDKINLPYKVKYHHRPSSDEKQAATLAIEKLPPDPAQMTPPAGIPKIQEFIKKYEQLTSALHQEPEVAGNKALRPLWRLRPFQDSHDTTVSPDQWAHNVIESRRQLMDLRQTLEQLSIKDDKLKQQIADFYSSFQTVFEMFMLRLPLKDQEVYLFNPFLGSTSRQHLLSAIQLIADTSWFIFHPNPWQIQEIFTVDGFGSSLGKGGVFDLAQPKRIEIDLHGYPRGVAASILIHENVHAEDVKTERVQRLLEFQGGEKDKSISHPWLATRTMFGMVRAGRPVTLLSELHAYGIGLLASLHFLKGHSLKESEKDVVSLLMVEHLRMGREAFRLLDARAIEGGLNEDEKAWLAELRVLWVQLEAQVAPHERAVEVNFARVLASDDPFDHYWAYRSLSWAAWLETDSIRKGQLHNLYSESLSRESKAFLTQFGKQLENVIPAEFLEAIAEPNISIRASDGSVFTFSHRVDLGPKRDYRIETFLNGRQIGYIHFSLLKHANGQSFASMDESFSDTLGGLLSGEALFVDSRLTKRGTGQYRGMGTTLLGLAERWAYKLGASRFQARKVGWPIFDKFYKPLGYRDSEAAPFYDLHQTIEKELSPDSFAELGIRPDAAMAKAIAAQIGETAMRESKPGQRYVIGIGGPPAVGKSTRLAPLLNSYLEAHGKKSLVVSMDDLFKSPEVRKQLPSQWDETHVRLDQARNLQAVYKSGAKSYTTMRYDRSSKDKKYSLHTYNFEGIDFLIFEGLWEIADEHRLGNLRQHVDLPVYMDASITDIKQWRYEQESKKLSPRTEEEMQKEWEADALDIQTNIEPSKKNARFVVFVNSDRSWTMQAGKTDLAMTSQKEYDNQQREKIAAGLDYTTALQYYLDWRLTKVLPRAFWTNPITAINYVLAILDVNLSEMEAANDPLFNVEQSAFKIARDQKNIKRMAELYRKHVLAYTSETSDGKGAVDFFYEVGGLKTLMSIKRDYLINQGSAYALLKLLSGKGQPLEGLVDEDNKDALKPWELSRRWGWTEARAKRAFINTLQWYVPGFQQAMKQGNIRQAAQLYRDHVIAYRTKDPGGRNGQLGFFMEVGGLGGLFLHKREFLEKMSPASLMKLALPGLVDPNNKYALKPWEIEHGTWTRETARAALINVLTWHVPGFREMMDSKNIEGMAKIYRREVVNYPADPLNYHGRQQAFFYEVGGLRGLMANPRDFLDKEGSSAALLRLATGPGDVLEGLIDDSNPVALHHDEIEHTMQGEAGPGGIDLNSDKLDLQRQNIGGEIKFRVDPAMLKQLQNASGLVPIIVDIQPLMDLRKFLGLKT